MLKILRRAVREGTVTNDFPGVVIEPPEGFRGKPVIDFERCTACDRCAAACPTNAISVSETVGENGVTVESKILSVDYGDCIFCGECEAACPDTVRLTKEFQLAASNKAHLMTRARYTVDQSGNSKFAEIILDVSSKRLSVEELGAALKERVHALFGRSLHIREVDAGSCNGCEVEISALNNPIYDIERFGVHFVASPRHADMLLVTGPVSRNMEIALKQTYDATPSPKLVVAVGACAIHGGIFGSSYASCGGADSVIPVDVYIPGCPPRPEALLQGILLAMGQSTQRTSPGAASSAA
jgi:Ni,Fe-hydrogenase III small subunit/formate hydrogenlyase subunit 6/NADH:ubiquinone oxidoreductase subunit I